MSWKWFEVWFDDSPGLPYLLLLVATSSGFSVIDPKEGNRLVMKTDDLEEARIFLAEDEYTLVHGRTADES